MSVQSRRSSGTRSFQRYFCPRYRVEEVAEYVAFNATSVSVQSRRSSGTRSFQRYFCPRYRVEEVAEHVAFNATSVSVQSRRSSGTRSFQRYFCLCIEQKKQRNAQLSTLLLSLYRVEEVAERVAFNATSVSVQSRRSSGTRSFQRYFCLCIEQKKQRNAQLSTLLLSLYRVEEVAERVAFNATSVSVQSRRSSGTRSFQRYFCLCTEQKKQRNAQLSTLLLSLYRVEEVAERVAFNATSVSVQSRRSSGTRSFQRYFCLCTEQKKQRNAQLSTLLLSLYRVEEVAERVAFNATSVSVQSRRSSGTRSFQRYFCLCTEQKKQRNAQLSTLLLSLYRVEEVAERVAFNATSVSVQSRRSSGTRSFQRYFCLCTEQKKQRNAQLSTLLLSLYRVEEVAERVAFNATSVSVQSRRSSGTRSFQRYFCVSTEQKKQRNAQLSTLLLSQYRVEEVAERVAFNATSVSVQSRRSSGTRSFQRYFCLSVEQKKQRNAQLSTLLLSQCRVEEVAERVAFNATSVSVQSRRSSGTRSFQRYFCLSVEQKKQRNAQLSTLLLSQCRVEEVAERVAFNATSVSVQSRRSSGTRSFQRYFCLSVEQKKQRNAQLSTLLLSQCRVEEVAERVAFNATYVSVQSRRSSGTRSFQRYFCLSVEQKKQRNAQLSTLLLSQCRVEEVAERVAFNATSVSVQSRRSSGTRSFQRYFCLSVEQKKQRNAQLSTLLLSQCRVEEVAERVAFNATSVSVQSRRSSGTRSFQRYFCLSVEQKKQRNAQLSTLLLSQCRVEEVAERVAFNATSVSVQSRRSSGTRSFQRYFCLSVEQKKQRNAQLSTLLLSQCRVEEVAERVAFNATSVSVQSRRSSGTRSFQRYFCLSVEQKKQRNAQLSTLLLSQCRVEEVAERVAFNATSVSVQSRRSSGTRSFQRYFCLSVEQKKQRNAQLSTLLLSQCRVEEVAERVAFNATSVSVQSRRSSGTRSFQRYFCLSVEQKKQRNAQLSTLLLSQCRVEEVAERVAFNATSVSVQSRRSSGTRSFQRYFCLSVEQKKQRNAQLSTLLLSQCRVEEVAERVAFNATSVSVQSRRSSGTRSFQRYFCLSVEQKKQRNAQLSTLLLSQCRVEEVAERVAFNATSVSVQSRRSSGTRSFQRYFCLSTEQKKQRNAQLSTLLLSQYRVEEVAERVAFNATSVSVQSRRSSGTRSFQRYFCLSIEQKKQRNAQLSTLLLSQYRVEEVAEHVAFNATSVSVQSRRSSGTRSFQRYFCLSIEQKKQRNT